MRHLRKTGQLLGINQLFALRAKKQMHNKEPLRGAGFQGWGIHQLQEQCSHYTALHGVKHLKDGCTLNKPHPLCRTVKKFIFGTTWRKGGDKVQVKIPSSTNFNPSPTDMLETVPSPEKSSLLPDSPGLL